jgi:hypothetical protein
MAKHQCSTPSTTCTGLSPTTALGNLDNETLIEVEYTPMHPTMSPWIDPMDMFPRKMREYLNGVRDGSRPPLELSMWNVTDGEKLIIYEMRMKNPPIEVEHIPLPPKILALVDPMDIFAPSMKKSIKM